MKYDVIDVRPVGHLRLKVTFEDGLSGEIIFRDTHLEGVFESLKNPQLFSQVHCAHGFVEWPGEIDLAPDAMYEAVKNSGYLELV